MLNTSNYSLVDCECGITLEFPETPETLSKKEEYFLYFSVESALPKNPASDISISPNSYTISSTGPFSAKTIVKVKSVHRGETQSLIKLSIKDRYNTILHTDYIKVVCSPQETESNNGTILIGTGNIGPNGGSIMNVSSTANLDIGMLVTGGDIKTPVYIQSILSGTQIELTTLFTDAITNTTANYTFTRTTSCVDPETLRRRSFDSNIVVLDRSNNWTYTYNDKLILQFIRTDRTDSSISVEIPAKNLSTLSGSGKKQEIPGVAQIKAVGRVTNDQNCIP
jgi:hypothetical protein